MLGSLVVLTLGIGVGAASFERGDFDAAMAVTFADLRHSTRLCSSSGTRAGAAAARPAEPAGFALVAIVLPLTHFAS